MHPTVLALNDHLLDNGYLSSAFHSINIPPGQAAQRLRHDDQYVTVPRPHRPFGAVCHHGGSGCVHGGEWGHRHRARIAYSGGDGMPERAEAVSVAMPAGSMMYFVGTLGHGGGRNASGAERLAPTAQYCQPWMTQLENQQPAVDWDKLDDIPPRLVGMMGYKVGMPLIGYVDGRSPRTRVAELLDEWKGQS
ncbi:phytanoyl-CoA dioxygenase family protein [Metarhizium album ARSEF 1941]|uniref:Phytanoyl-CoA dioxygenase family protein n=1 Tax=Metarhizium album (strain ARSEF 1941) TaxID=1081103 RepID=A0A0B2WV45_METAS|nr:phytanoyl-CoA dioxygenase family protein [Metarhizium album ARSEF 1941]KHN97953.1 phytanoyl-CoA dioxygenase family protein [Metarhizium album ARSEF 1941]